MVMKVYRRNGVHADEEAAFTRCCSLMADMMEKYGHKVLEKLKKRNAILSEVPLQWEQRKDSDCRKRISRYYERFHALTLEKSA